MTGSQVAQNSGQPCSSRSGGPAPGSATCSVAPGTGTRVWRISMVVTAAGARAPQLEAVKLRPVAPASLPRLPKRDENPLQQLQPEVWAAAAPGARVSPAALRP